MLLPGFIYIFTLFMLITAHYNLRSIILNDGNKIPPIAFGTFGKVNPTMADMGLVAYCQSEDIQVMSYAPFGFAVPRPFNNKTLPPQFDDPTLVEIANKYDKSTSQVFLRYLIQRGTIPIPKSTNNEHIRSNIDVFDFALTREEVYKISEFDIDAAVYLQKGLFPTELFTYIYGASLEEVFNSQA